MFETGMDGRIQPTHIPRTALGRKRFACVGANVYNLDLDARKNLPREDEDVIDGVIGGDDVGVGEAGLACHPTCSCYSTIDHHPTYSCC